MSQLRVDDLTKRYGDVTALEDVSFQVETGEFVVILGVSGSGKSTLLRCMAGLTEPTDGTVHLGDSPITDPRPDVAMIFQQHNIIDDLTTYANALTGGINEHGFLESVLQLQDEPQKIQALDALSTVGLLDKATTKARRLSGGEQQRVGIARALVQRPAVLLADEPVASLDPGSAQDVMEYLRSVSEHNELTTFTSLHQVNIARKYGQRFIGLRNGRKVFDGYRAEMTIDTIDEIYGDIDTEGMFVTDDRPEPELEATT